MAAKDATKKPDKPNPENKTRPPAKGAAPGTIRAHFQQQQPAPAQQKAHSQSDHGSASNAWKSPVKRARLGQASSAQRSSVNGPHVPKKLAIPNNALSTAMFSAARGTTPGDSDDDEEDARRNRKGFAVEKEDGEEEVSTLVAKTKTKVKDAKRLLIFLNQALQNMKFIKVTEKYDERIYTALREHFVDYYVVLREIQDSNLLHSTTVCNAPEHAWVTMALHIDPLTLPPDLKWVMQAINGKTDEETVAAVDPALVQSPFTIPLSEDSITRWLLPSVFWNLEMPEEVLRVIMYRCALMVVKDGKKERIPKESRMYTRTSENAVMRRNDINRRMVTLCTDVCYWTIMKNQMKKVYPVFICAPLGKPDEEERLENFLVDSIVKEFGAEFERTGRENVLLSRLPLAADGRYDRYNPHMQRYCTPQNVLEDTLPAIEAKDAQCQIQGSVSMTDKQIQEEKARVQQLAIEFEEHKKKWAKIPERDRPTSFTDSHGEIISFEWFEKKTQSLSQETRDVWMLHAFTRWWRGRLSREFSDHVIFWWDWGSKERNAVQRISQTQGPDKKTRRPLIVCVGDNLWFVHYKEKFYKSKSKCARSLISAICLWYNIIRHDFESDLGDASKLPAEPEFWTKSREERESELKAQSKAYVYVDAFDAAFGKAKSTASAAASKPSASPSPEKEKPPAAAASASASNSNPTLNQMLSKTS